MNRRDFLHMSSLALLGASVGCSKPRSDDLYQICRGIYGLIGSSIAQSHAAVLVHPYFIDPDENRSYYKNLDRFLAEYDGVLVTLEEYAKLADTVNTISDQRNGEMLFVPTEIAASTPHENNWWGIANYLRKFSKSPLKLLGGYYDGCGYGCLGNAQRKLKDNNLETAVLRELTFSRNLFPEANF